MMSNYYNEELPNVIEDFMLFTDPYVCQNYLIELLEDVSGIEYTEIELIAHMTLYPITKREMIANFKYLLNYIANQYDKNHKNYKYILHWLVVKDFMWARTIHHVSLTPIWYQTIAEIYKQKQDIPTKIIDMLKVLDEQFNIDYCKIESDLKPEPKASNRSNFNFEIILSDYNNIVNNNNNKSNTLKFNHFNNQDYKDCYIECGDKATEVNITNIYSLD